MKKQAFNKKEYSRFKDRIFKKLYKYIYENNLEINNENINRYVIENYNKRTAEPQKSIFEVLWELEARNIKTAEDLLLFINVNKLKSEGFKFSTSISKVYEDFCIHKQIKSYNSESLELFIHEIKEVLNKENKEGN